MSLKNPKCRGKLCGRDEELGGRCLEAPAECAVSPSDGSKQQIARLRRLPARKSKA